MSRIATAVAAAAALGVAAAPAAAEVKHQRDDFLRFPANKPFYMKDRKLTLHGTYLWTGVSRRWSDRNPTQKPRTLRLFGTYKLQDSLEHKLGTRGYVHWSKLINVKTGGKASIRVVVNGKDGRFDWGSKIQNVRGT